MALRTVLKEGDPQLRKKSRAVSRFDRRLGELAEDMLDTMRAENGVGLAAPQVGILKRMFVMNVGDESGDTVIVNPRILDRQGEQREAEGCLSLPGLYGFVSRPEKLRLQYENLEGKTCELEAEGLKAICVCHETDHLDGILFRDLAENGLFTVNEEGEAIPEGEQNPKQAVNKAKK